MRVGLLGFSFLGFIFSAHWASAFTCEDLWLSQPLSLDEFPRALRRNPRHPRYAEFVAAYHERWAAVDRVNSEASNPRELQFSYYQPVVYEGKFQLHKWGTYRGQDRPVIRTDIGPLVGEKGPAGDVQAAFQGLLRRRYEESGYSEAETQRVMEIENQIDPLRRAYFIASEISSGEAREILRLYDASSTIEGLADFTSIWVPKNIWKPILQDTRLPLEIAYPNIKIDQPFKIELGRFAKDRSVESAQPMMSFVASFISVIHGNSTDLINPLLRIYLTAHAAQSRYYQQFGFVLADASLQPPRGSAEVLLEMSGQAFYDRFAHPSNDMQPTLKRQSKSVNETGV